jgi:CRISPR-associated endonuclease/helicase Cas3
MPYASKAAQSALEISGLNVEAIRPSRQPSFSEQFPSFAQPNPIQDTVEELPIPGPGSLAIIEGETGSGKTEAALRYYGKLFCAGKVDSLYLANPLRFAATQLHTRAYDFMRNWLGDSAPPVILAVPGYLRLDDMSGYQLPDYQVLWWDKGSEVYTRRGWACEHPKRFLSAPVAVGTIDQVLLAAMRVPHAHLRMAGLSRSLLVIDEVHASDSYMTELTLGVLRFMRHVGGHVLLMSATLGSTVRQRYLDVMTGKKHQPPGLEDAIGTSYPLVTTSDQGRLHARSSSADKSVTIELHPFQQDPGRVASLAKDLVEQGACILILRNTVKQAVATAKAIEELISSRPELLFSVNGVPTLHHSRFSRKDRMLLDNAVSDRFGQGGTRPSQILVSTQTLEQSLDVDFDILLTDLCPMDVLLQRIGRLHRHKNDRPEKFSSARCLVLVPGNHSAGTLLQQDIQKSGGYGLQRPYEDLRILEATWRKLENFSREDHLMSIPAMNRELVEETVHPSVLDDLVAELGQEWKRHAQDIAGQGISHAQLASLQLIDWHKPFGPESSAGRLDERAATRLGVGDMTVDFPGDVPGPFGQKVSQLRIPLWMITRADSEEEPENVVADQGRINFTYGGRRLVYDRFGLRHEKEEKE